MHSLWAKTVSRSRFPSLEGNKRTDVLIVGGGIAGILCAYMLGRAGVDCMLVEADRICGGITQNTTAKITLQHGLLYDKLIRKYGKDTADLDTSTALLAPSLAFHKEKSHVWFSFLAIRHML